MRLRLDARIVIGDAGTPQAWWDGKPYDRILIDAPCSATGVLRRRPAVRLHRRASDLSALSAQQRRIVAALWPLLAPGGRLVDFTLPVGQPAAVGWQILPGDGDLDGMYYAVVRKQSA